MALASKQPYRSAERSAQGTVASIRRRGQCDVRPAHGGARRSEMHSEGQSVGYLASTSVMEQKTLSGWLLVLGGRHVALETEPFTE